MDKTIAIQTNISILRAMFTSFKNVMFSGLSSFMFLFITNETGKYSTEDLTITSMTFIGMFFATTTLSLLAFYRSSNNKIWWVLFLLIPVPLVWFLTNKPPYLDMAKWVSLTMFLVGIPISYQYHAIRYHQKNLRELQKSSFR